MNVGSIHWVELPGANGHEQQGRRPAVVLQSEKLSSNLPTVLVVPLTSTQKALRFSGTVPIKPSPANGLRQASVALSFKYERLTEFESKIGLANCLTKILGRSLVS